METQTTHSQLTSEEAGTLHLIRGFHSFLARKGVNPGGLRAREDWASTGLLAGFDAAPFSDVDAES